MRKIFWLAVLCLLLAANAAIFGAGRPAAQVLNLPEGGVVAADDDEEKPDVTGRVARISFIRGEVKIKRIGSDDWEKAVLNLPLIEGDEISTGTGARLELQFNNYVHVRLDQEGSLKFSVMKDEGVALSLSQGTMNLRVTNFDKAGGYFEIDAPKTTIAVEKSGSYRVDAGKAGDAELHVSVTSGGSARIYSENAGFTLKSGRGARVFVTGNNAGEWETADAAKFGDDFDTWTADRDATIAKRLSAAYYDKYYDEDIYGADDLNDNGEWVYTSTYGYVWRPYASALSGYADWSPYRYGSWRWVGAYGWTWVNDEPWGWATYHHGRWVYDRGYWVWCPYGYYRPRHSWWFPAIVSINIFNDNVCWYPLGYRHRWRNYNGHGHGGNVGGTRVELDQKVRHGVRGNPGDATVGVTEPPIPITGIVSVPVSDFGTKTGRIKPVPPPVAKVILAKGEQDGGAALPDGREVMRGRKNDVATTPPVFSQGIPVKIGAAERVDAKPLDTQLRETKIFGGRAKAPVNETATSSPLVEGPRSTGAVVRLPRERKLEDTAERVESKPADTERISRPRPVKVEADRPETVERKPAERETKQRETRSVERPVQIAPREERPTRSEPPRQTPPARSDPPPQREPPRTEPKPVEKPSVVEHKERTKDGR